MRIKNVNFIRSIGFTLIELVIALAVLAVGLGAFLTLIINSTVRSADPMVYQQANSIAQSYLEEALLNSFCDPDLIADCPTTCNAGNVCTNCSENTGGTETRATFDDVCDYDAINDTAGAIDINSGTISGLESYNVNVTVNGASANLNGLTSANGQALRVDVRVTHDSFSDLDLTISGYKANY